MTFYSRFYVIPLILIGSILSNPSAYSATSIHSEIKSWRPLGPLWAGGLNSTGEVIAIYDLSYPEPLIRIPLGLLDPSATAYEQLIDLLYQGKKDWLTNAMLTRTSPMSEQPDRITEVEQAIKALTDQKKQIQINAKQMWWKDIPWKSESLRQSDQPPEHFYLSDIHYEKLASNFDQFKSGLSKLSRIHLDQIEFVRNSDGNYEFFWSPKALSNKSNPDAPFKIADLQCTDCGFIENLARTETRNLIGKLIELIPVPYFAGLMGIALNEFYLFQDELLYNHQEMLLELIRSQEEGLSSPSLTPQERELAIDYLFYSRTDASGAKEWISKKPIEKWSQQEQDSLTQATRSIQYLTNHAQTVTSINPRFAVGKAADSTQRIYSLSAALFWNLLPPFVAYDYSKPTAIRNGRIGIETAHVLVQFISVFSPIPIVGPIVSKAFDWLLESPMHTLQHWEARLATHLHSRIGRGESWASELQILLQQAINPMELSSEAQEELVKARKQKLRIP